MNNNDYVKPILKWAGGKRELASTIRSFYHNIKFNNYIEPFFGGGSVYFDMLNFYGSGYSKKSIINDINKDLINLYKHIKTDPEKIIYYCQKLEQNYYEDGYYSIRDRFNGVTKEKIQTVKYEGIERSSALILLNKTCFNGLYRVNKKGLFNVPKGNYKNPKIIDKNNLLKMSKLLPQINNIKNEQFFNLKINQKDLVYFDPPYHPLNESSSFTAYSGDFGEKEQTILKDFFTELDKKGVYVILSNSSTKLIKKLYENFKIIEVSASRNINSKSDKRGKITELIIIGNSLINY